MNCVDPLSRWYTALDNFSMSFDLLFLGTGASTAVPELGHVLRKDCEVCVASHLDPLSKNRRNNVSVALLFKSSNGTQRCVLVDCGKTMRQACITHLFNHGISSVDSLILTHGHADAMLGLDDLRY